VAAVLLFIYGRILHEALKQRAKVTATLKSQQMVFSILPKQTSSATQAVSSSATAEGSSATMNKDMPHCSSAAAQQDHADVQRRSKTRRGEYKAVHLTAAICGAFVVL